MQPNNRQWREHVRHQKQNDAIARREINFEKVLIAELNGARKSWALGKPPPRSGKVNLVDFKPHARRASGTNCQRYGTVTAPEVEHLVAGPCGRGAKIEWTDMIQNEIRLALYDLPMPPMSIIAFIADDGVLKNGQIGFPSRAYANMSSHVNCGKWQCKRR